MGIPKDYTLANEKVFDVSEYGAVPDTGGDQAAPIQAALDAANSAGGGIVMISRPGLYLVSGALTAISGTTNYTNRTALSVGTNTKILCAKGVRIQLTPWANCYLIGNRDWTNGNYDIEIEGGVWDGNGGINVVNGVVGAGNLLQLTFTNPYFPASLTTAALAGETVSIKARVNSPSGGATAEWSYPITAVTNNGNNSYTLTVSVSSPGGFNLTAAGGGSDLRGLVTRQTRYPSGSPRYNGGLSCWSKVTRFTVKNATFVNANKYCLTVCGCNAVKIDSIYFNTGSDGIHLIGPGSDYEISNLSGTTGDNMIAIATDDTGYYTWPTEGNLSYVNVRNVVVTDCLEPIRILSGKTGTPYALSNIRISGVSGSVTNYSYGIRVATDGTITTGTIKDLLIEDVSLSITTSGYAVVVIDNNYVEDVKVRNIYARSANNQLVDVTSLTASLKSLDISGIMAPPSVSHSQAAVRINGTVTALNLSNFNYYCGNGGSVLNIGSTGIVTSGSVSNGYSTWVAGTSRGFYFQNLTTASSITVSSVVFKSHVYAMDISGDITLTLGGVIFDGCTENMVVRNGSGTANVTVFGAGVYASAGGDALKFSGSSGCAIRVNNPDVTVNATSASFSGTVGDRCINSTAGTNVPIGEIQCAAAGSPGTWVHTNSQQDQLLTVYTGISVGTSAANTTIYTPTSGKSAVIRRILLVNTAVSTPTGGPAVVSAGITGAGYTDIMGAQTLTSFTTANLAWDWLKTTAGLSSVVTNAAPLVLRVSTGWGSGSTTMTAYVYGTLY